MNDSTDSEAYQTDHEDWDADIEAAFRESVQEFQTEDVSIRRFVGENIALLEVFTVLAALLAIAPLLGSAMLESLLSFALLTMIVLVFVEIRNGFPLGIAFPLTKDQRLFHEARIIGTHMRYGRIKTFSILLDGLVVALATGTFLRYQTLSLIYVSLFLVLTGISLSYHDMVLKRFPLNPLEVLKGRASKRTYLGLASQAAGLFMFLYATTRYVPRLGDYPSLKDYVFLSAIFVPVIFLNLIFFGRQYENVSVRRKRELHDLLSNQNTGNEREKQKSTLSESPRKVTLEPWRNGKHPRYWRDLVERK